RASAVEAPQADRGVSDPVYAKPSDTMVVESAYGPFEIVCGQEIKYEVRVRRIHLGPLFRFYRTHPVHAVFPRYTIAPDVFLLAFGPGLPIIKRPVEHRAGLKVLEVMGPRLHHTLAGLIIDLFHQVPHHDFAIAKAPYPSSIRLAGVSIVPAKYHYIME